MSVPLYDLHVVDEIEIFKDTTVESFGVDAQALFS